MGIDRALLAGHLCELLPSRVRGKVLADDAFVASYGPFARTVMTIGSGPSIDQLELFRAVRRSFATHATQEIIDIAGRQILVNCDHDTVALRMMVGTEAKPLTELQDLMILSPNPHDRSRTLSRLLDRLGPTAPDLSTLKCAANERELTDREVTKLLEEVMNGFEAHRARITMAHNADKILLADIVPDVLSYYERFCGPTPHDIVPEEYLTKTLPSYRRQLLGRSFARGLEICLLGSLRDDLMPATWSETVSDDEMWDALSAIDLRGNPFALLGALDIAIARQHDQRYMTFADGTISTLLQEQLPRPDGVDSYELLPLFTQLVLNRINAIEGGASCEPFWKRMCAWMHAGLLMQSTLHIQIKLDAFREWADSQRCMAGIYAQMVDLRREPMYRAGAIAPSSLREEVIGRLVLLRTRHQAAGRLVPCSKEIDEAMTRLTEQGSPLGWAMPGPLDGHLRPAAQKRASLSEPDVNHVLEELSKDPNGAIWSKLAYFSQCIDLGEQILSRACEAVAQAAFEFEQVEGTKRPNRLYDIALIAAAHRNTNLARLISARILERASHSKSGAECLSILHVLLVAGAAFEREDEWSSWIEEQFTSLAYRLPPGEGTRTLVEHLNEIKNVLPRTIAFCSRPEAVASAAI